MSLLRGRCGGPAGLGLLQMQTLVDSPVHYFKGLTSALQVLDPTGAPPKLPM